MSTPTVDRPLALVTGASSGIGLALANELASRGYDLVLAADEDLSAAEAEVRSHGAAVRAVRTDLSTFEGVEELGATAAAAGRLDVLCCNAGIGLGGDFVRDETLEDALRLVQVNVVSVVHLTKLALPHMVERGGGHVLFTSSIAALMPGPYQALYNASKAFLLHFSEALAEELKDTGVVVTAVMPGPTDTQFFDRADLTDTRLGASKHKDDPADVARRSVDALFEAKTREVVGGAMSRAQAAMSEVLPDSITAKLHRAMAEPGSAP